MSARKCDTFIAFVIVVVPSTTRRLKSAMIIVLVFFFSAIFDIHTNHPLTTSVYVGMSEFLRSSIRFDPIVTHILYNVVCCTKICNGDYDEEVTTKIRKKTTRPVRRRRRRIFVLHEFFANMQKLHSFFYLSSNRRVLCHFCAFVFRSFGRRLTEFCFTTFRRF